MKNVKKLLSVVLTLCMVLSLLPMTAWAATYTVGTYGTYTTLSAALAAAGDGDTITLLNDISESVSYTFTADKTITIDGGGYTVTAPDTADSDSIALSLIGTGTVILKNITLQGGSANSGNSSYGLCVSEANIRSLGTVAVKGGAADTCYGVYNYGPGTVDVTTATASEGTYANFGACSQEGTLNVGTAVSSGANSYGVANGGSGTINVTTATGGSSWGARNDQAGTINVTTANGGVYNASTGTINVTTADSVDTNDTGTVNAGTITGSAYGTGINTGTDVAAVTLNAGTGTSCVLASITVAAAGNTTVGTLPSVYNGSAYSNTWYTNNAKASPFSETYVTGATTLLSYYYDLVKINSAAIAGVTAPVTGATPTSSITDTTEYTATISWSPADATFAASTAYTATITITPKTGYTLTGVAANSFSVAGADTTTNAADSSVVTAVFPATATAVINTPAIAGVTAPVTGATPTSTIADTTEYTATISWSPSASTFAASTAYTATITLTPKTGYTLSGIPANFFTVAGATATNAADSGVVTAVFPATAAASSGGTGEGGSSSGGSSTTNPTTTVSGSTATTTVTPTISVGAATGTVTASQMSDALDKAKAAAGTSGTPYVKIQIDGASGASSVGMTIPRSSMQALVSGGTGALTISGPTGSVSFDAEALKTITGAASGDVTVTMAKTNSAQLSDAVKTLVGSHPVFAFSVTSGGSTISQLGGSVTVSVPYTPAAGEDLNAIVLYYIGANGKLETVTNGHYAAATGTVVFTTTHFSTYAVGYNKVSFTDVSNTAWYADAVTFLAARGITSGTTATTFSPDTTLTRGQFITMLLRTYDVEADANPTNNFSDAGDTYYTGYLAAAKKLGITSGIGENKFAPDQAITRQEMFTMLYNALKVLGKLPEAASGKTLSDFTDAGDVASWASEAMTLMVETGTVSGSGGTLNPTATTTRAEMAQVLYNLLAR